MLMLCACAIGMLMLLRACGRNARSSGFFLRARGRNASLSGIVLRTRAVGMLACQVFLRAPNRNAPISGIFLEGQTPCGPASGMLKECYFSAIYS